MSTQNFRHMASLGHNRLNEFQLERMCFVYKLAIFTTLFGHFNTCENMSYAWGIEKSINVFKKRCPKCVKLGVRLTIVFTV